MGSEVLERLGMAQDWHTRRAKARARKFKLAHYRSFGSVLI